MLCIVKLSLIGVCLLVTCVICGPLGRAHNFSGFASTTLTRRLSICLPIRLSRNERVLVGTLATFINFDFSCHSLWNRRITFLTEFVLMTRVQIWTWRAKMLLRNILLMSGTLWVSILVDGLKVDV